MKQTLPLPFLDGQLVICRDIRIRTSNPPASTYLGNVVGLIEPRIGRGPRDAMGNYLVNVTPTVSEPMRRHVILVHQSEMESLDKPEAARD